VVLFAKIVQIAPPPEFSDALSLPVNDNEALQSTYRNRNSSGLFCNNRKGGLIDIGGGAEPALFERRLHLDGGGLAVLNK
jgi:hypothetical protein